MPMNKLANSHRAHGFTLVEVLVASVILFSSLAAVTLIYRGALLSSTKANQEMASTSVVPVILQHIRSQIRANGNNEAEELSGSGEEWEVNYNWQAVIKSYKPAPPIFDVDSGQYVTQPLKYKLWQVELTMNTQGTERSYSYEELSWNEN